MNPSKARYRKLDSTGKALIFSAPSGSGKTTVVHHLLKVFPQLKFSVSATTRKPRAYEVNGRDYHFLSDEEFDGEEFVEIEEVYNGVRYGTLKSEVERIWKEGKVVVFDVDVKGGLNLKRFFGESSLAVFIRVSDVESIKERLKSRSTESDKSLRSRFEKIKYELSFQDKFEYILINDNLEKALKEAEKLVSSFLRK